MSIMPPDTRKMIDKLIALPSISGGGSGQDQSNQPIINQLADWCTDLGFRTEIMAVSGYPGKFNLLATLGSGPGGLVLSGHSDTVAYDENRWQHDPFRVTEANNRLYGLGTSDMKAFFALALEAARQFQAHDLKEPLILLATADEESSMSGAQALVKLGMPKARYALIGEPTGLRPVRQHKGILMESIRLRGQSGHSSDPSLGNSALEGMHRVLSALLAWREQLQVRYQNTAFHVPVPTMNFGHIHGGDNPNRICGDCELSLDLRALPGMTLKELREQIHALASQAVADSGLQIDFKALFDGVEAMETPADAQIIKLAEKLTGHSAEAVAFCTEAPYLQQLGMQTVVLGPGDIAQAHQPNEYLALERIPPMVEIIRRMIVDCCVIR